MGKGFDGSKYEEALPGQIQSSGSGLTTRLTTSQAPVQNSKGKNAELGSMASGYPVGHGHRMSEKMDHSDAGNRKNFHKAAETLPGCSDQHLKLLYLISLHARCAMNRWESEYWVRRNSLLALVYEAILAGVLDYNYAPEVQTIGKRRVWVNVSQDAQDDIDDLVGGKMLRELRMSTRAMQPVSALQVTKRGMRLVEASPAILHRIVEDFAFTELDELLTARWAERPKRIEAGGDAMPWDASEEEDLEASEEEEEEDEDSSSEEDGDTPAEVEVPWWDKVEEELDEEDFEVVCIVETQTLAVCRLSGVTRIEDVSYVTSPHLPKMLIDNRRKLRDLTDNSSRAHESAKGLSQVKDTFSEAVVLADVQLLVSEWLPFGPNMIASLNQRLGASDRIKGGMFTSEIDYEPGVMTLETKRKMTKVSIIECNEIDHCNLEANISLPEKSGVIQVESFGIHVSKIGGLLFGMRIEAIQERVKKGISLDYLSRLIVDAHGDSSTIADSLLSEAQREMIQAVYGVGDTESRTKFNCIFAADIKPAVMAQKYLDGEDKENELRQVIGQCEWAHNLSTEDVVIMGKHGIILAGPHVQQHESYVQLICSLLTMKVFLKAIFGKVLFISQEVLLLRDLVEKARKQADLLPAIRRSLGRYGHTVALLQNCCNYMVEALLTIKNKPLPHALRDPWDITGRELLKCLPHIEWREKLELQLQDINESLSVCCADLAQCTMMTDTIDALRVHKQLNRINTLIHTCADGSKDDYKDSASILMMVLMVGSTFAWRAMDRITGADLKQMDWGPQYGYGYRAYAGPLEEADCGGGGAGTAEEGGGGAPEAEPCEVSAQPTSDLPTEQAERWQYSTIVSLSATPGLLGIVSVLWAAVFCGLMLVFLRRYHRNTDGFVRLNSKLDLPIKDFRYLAVFLATKKLITSRIEDVSGRDVK